MSRWDFVRGPALNFDNFTTPTEVPGVVIDREYPLGLLLVLLEFWSLRIGGVGILNLGYAITINGASLGSLQSRVHTEQGFLDTFRGWQVQTFAGGRARIAVEVQSFNGAGVHSIRTNQMNLFVLSLPQLERESIP